MHAWGQAHLFTEDQYWQVVIYKCWDPLDLSALRYPLITTLCPPPSSLPTSPSCNSSPRARYISTLQSAGLGYKLRSWLSSIDLHSIEIRNKRRGEGRPAPTTLRSDLFLLLSPHNPPAIRSQRTTGSRHTASLRFPPFSHPSSSPPRPWCFARDLIIDNLSRLGGRTVEKEEGFACGHLG